MTTIAYRDGVIAADSQENWESDAGGASKHKCVKLYRKRVPTGDGTSEDVILATAGSTYPGMLFVDWFGSGKDIPDALTLGTNSEEDFDVLILRKSGLFISNRLCRPVKIEDEFIAVGSGRKAALAAMHCGKNAAEAVEIALRIDPYSGGKILTMSLEDWPKPKRRRRKSRADAPVQDNGIIE